MVIENRSALPWTLTLLEGLKPQCGTLTLKDRAQATPLGTLTKPGEAITLPPKGTFMAIFERKSGYLYQNLMFKDIQGHYAEFLAHIEFLSNPVITLQLVGHRVGPPLDRADEGTLRQFINDSIEVGSDSITIHPNTLEGH
jgi:hypothetical protein